MAHFTFLVLGSLMLAALGISLVAGSISAMVHRRRRINFRRPPRVRRILLLWSSFTLVGGCSMILAAGLLWSRWQFALVLGSWPLAVFALLRCIRRVTVVSHL